MKKIALISPKGNVFGKSEKMNLFLSNTKHMESFKFLWTGPNLGLLTIAALFPDDWECDYIDENIIDIDFDKQYDLVCISAMTQQVNNAYNIATIFKGKGVLTVIGGIHATILPEEASLYADVVIAGEGEVLWPEFIKDYLNGQYRKVYMESKPGSYMLYNSPAPRYDLLKCYDYPLITLQTTRGCPHDCIFCAASKVFGRKYRRKSNDQILNELIDISLMFPGRLILFADDNMFVLRHECMDLLSRMKGMNLRWIAQTDVSIAEDKEFLRLMVEAGCQWIVIGFESPSYDSLYELDKSNWKLNQMSSYSKSIQSIQSFGIGVYGTFIVGLDSDGSDIFEKTANFIKENKLYGANITVPTPLPGTRLREQLLKEGRVLVNDWEYYTFWDITIKPKRLSIEELEEGLLWIYNQITDSKIAEERLVYLKMQAKARRKIEKGISDVG